MFTLIRLGSFCHSFSPAFGVIKLFALSLDPAFGVTGPVSHSFYPAFRVKFTLFRHPLGPAEPACLGYFLLGPIKTFPQSTQSLVKAGLQALPLVTAGLLQYLQFLFHFGSSLRQFIQLFLVLGSGFGLA